MIFRPRGVFLISTLSNDIIDIVEVIGNTVYLGPGQDNPAETTDFVTFNDVSESENSTRGIYFGNGIIYLPGNGGRTKYSNFLGGSGVLADFSDSGGGFSGVEFAYGGPTN